MAQILHFDQPPPTPAPEPGGYVETETARDVIRSLELAMVTRGATMIAGASGLGKTTAVNRFCEGRGDDRSAGKVLRMTATSGMGSPWWVATELLRPWNKTPAKSDGITGTFDFLADVLAPNGYRMILVDEAQYLDKKGRRGAQQGEAFEWLRQLAEAAGIALAFVGDLALLDGIGRFPQLESRMRRPVVLRTASEADVAELAAPYGVTGAAEVRALTATARLPGSLRNVGDVLDMARVFAGAAPLDGGHIREAITDLKLDPKGARA